ncbi:eukaryotic translation initiation factor 3 subunit J [Fennellomyces sp. T-0311]|nr:eukaryotic translation initiation factor 3 subunit J [Fennellomyces sp. T-0311]
MSDWEDEKEFEVAVPKKSKWDDEDVEDDVKDDWEEESEEEEKEEKKLPPVRKKVPLAQKIAEKKAAEEEKKKIMEAKKAAIRAQEEETDEDAFERKQRMRQLELEADMNNATDLFSGVSVSKDDKKSIEDFKPKTRVEYTDYAKRLSEVILANSKSPHYGVFLDALVREIAVPCKDMDIRKAASSLTAMANDKQRQAKEATKAKKKGKPQLAAAGKSSALDESPAYRDVYDDFDDFM